MWLRRYCAEEPSAKLWLDLQILSRASCECRVIGTSSGGLFDTPNVGFFVFDELRDLNLQEEAAKATGDTVARETKLTT